MSDRAISINPATPRFGAFVSGIDITRPLSNLEVSTLHEALADHQVLFFRDQPFTFDSQKAFGRLFGDLHIHPNTPGPEGHPEILPIHADANRSVSTASAGTLTSPAIPNPRSAACCICTPSRRSAATRCSPACMPPMKRCRRA